MLFDAASQPRRSRYLARYAGERYQRVSGELGDLHLECQCCALDPEFPLSRSLLFNRGMNQAETYSGRPAIFPIEAEVATRFIVRIAGTVRIAVETDHIPALSPAFKSCGKDQHTRPSLQYYAGTTMPASPLSRILFAQIWILVIGIAVSWAVVHANGMSRTCLLSHLLISFCSSAHSVRPGPLKRIFHPRKISTQVIPRAIPQDSPHNPPDHLVKRNTRSSWHDGKHKRSLVPSDKLLPSDALRLSFDIPSPRRLVSRGLLDDALTNENAYETVHLHMTPTEHLFHPQAKINYLSAAGDVLYSEPLQAHDHRVYTGEVLNDWSTLQRLKEDRVGGVYYPPGSEESRGVRGTATIHVYDHPEDDRDVRSTRFQGAFYVDGQLWHVMTRENYLRHAQDGDPEVFDLGEESGLVMFMEGDEHGNRDEAFGDRTMQRTRKMGCSHDDLAYNTNVTGHPVLKDRPRHPHSDREVAASFFPSLPSMPLSDSLYSLFPHGSESPRRSVSRRDDISTGGNAKPSTNYINNIGQTAGCPTEQRIVYMGVAADCNYISTYGGAEQARTQILTNWNR